VVPFAQQVSSGPPQILASVCALQHLDVGEAQILTLPSADLQQTFGGDAQPGAQKPLPALAAAAAAGTAIETTSGVARAATPSRAPLFSAARRESASPWALPKLKGPTRCALRN
jgi:hypothetical protein